MADDGQQLLLTFEAKFERYMRNFERAQQQTDRRFKSMEQRAKEAGERMERSLATSAVNIGRSFQGIALAIGGSAAVRGAQKLVDEATRIRNSLKVAGLEGKELTKVYQQLFASAQKNAAPMGALADLFSKVAITQKELNVSTEDLLSFTDNVATALRVGGTNAQAASGSLLQLSQALGGGVVRAEEFNSILEGTPTIARTVARGLKEAGGSVAELRKLVVDGKLSSEAFFRAFQAGSVALQAQAEGSQITISQAFTRLGNSLVDVAGEFDKSTGASKRFADGITTLANVISNFDVSGFIGQIDEAYTAVERFLNNLGNAPVFKSLNQALGLMDEDGNVINLDAENAKAEAAALEREVELLQAIIKRNTELGFDNTEALGQLDTVMARLAQVRSAIAGMPATLPRVSDEKAADLINRMVPFNPLAPETSAAKPVSIADYAAPPGKGGTGGKGGGGGGSGGPNEYAREVESIRERIAALRAESEARRNATGSLEEQDAAVEQARMKHELLTAAQKAGLAVTPELEAQIGSLARSYSDAARETEALADAQQQAQESARDWANFGGSLVSGFVSDLRQGKSAAEALSNAVGKITDKLIDMAIQMLIVKPLLGMFGFSGGGFVDGAGGGFAGLIGYDSGGYTGHGGKYEPAGVVHRGEFVMSKEATSRIGVGNLEALHRGALAGYAAGGYVGNSPALRRAHMPANQNAPVQAISINAPITINGSAGTPEQNTDLAQKMAKQMEATMRGAVADEIRRQSRPGNFLNTRSR